MVDESAWEMIRKQRMAACESSWEKKDGASNLNKLTFCPMHVRFDHGSDRDGIFLALPPPDPPHHFVSLSSVGGEGERRCPRPKQGHGSPGIAASSYSTSEGILAQS